MGPSRRYDCNSNGVDDAIDIVLETSEDDNENGIPDECEESIRTLYIKPSVCPAPVNPSSNGVIPMLLVGDAGFDVNLVVSGSLELHRCDVGALVDVAGAPVAIHVTRDWMVQILDFGVLREGHGNSAHTAASTTCR